MASTAGEKAAMEAIPGIKERLEKMTLQAN
jgi:hypothetical protein